MQGERDSARDRRAHVLLQDGRAGDGPRPRHVRPRRRHGLPQPVAARPLRQPLPVRGRRGPLLAAVLRRRHPLAPPLQEAVQEEEVVRPRPVVLEAHLTGKVIIRVMVPGGSRQDRVNRVALLTLPETTERALCRTLNFTLAVIATRKEGHTSRCDDFDTKGSRSIAKGFANNA